MISSPYLNFFQISSYSQVLGIRTWTFLFRDHDLAHYSNQTRGSWRTFKQNRELRLVSSIRIEKWNEDKTIESISDSGLSVTSESNSLKSGVPTF